MWRISCLASCVALLVFALLGRSEEAEPQPDAKSNPAANAIVQRNNQFALELYAKLQQQDGNLFLSPYSISTSLGMTFAGARGDTSDQMAATLLFDKEHDRFHPAFGQLIKQINGDGKPRGYELSTANALWLQHDYHFLPDFLKLTQANYGAELREVDFRATEPTRQTINGWVEKQTKDKIKELIKPGIIDGSTKLVLTNAIYFKGKWSNPFKKESTRDEPFFLTDDKKMNTPMMHQEAFFGYTETDKVQVLEMAYEGKDLSMVVLLPKKVDGLADVENGLTWVNLLTWIGKLQKTEVLVTLPKFQMTSEFQLNKVLGDMGMKDAFIARKANFSGMTGSRDLFIAAVVHKAFVDVNEEGTEATAANAVLMEASSRRIMPTFRADHPFLFLIRDTRNGSVLFLGRVSNPVP